MHSMLTGESQPVRKHAAPLHADTELAERSNMAWAGTTVVAGQGSGLVIATGDHTETGRIAGLIAAAPDLVTPLTRKMVRFSNWLLWAIGGLAALTFAVGLARGETAFAMFMAAVALAVGAIPEGLPAAVTVTLAIGVARMARRKAIIRHLPAVESIGQHHRHLLRQDRHADRERDDRARAVVRRRRLCAERPRLFAGG